jgi:hypothetical protein
MEEKSNLFMRDETILPVDSRGMRVKPDGPLQFLAQVCVTTPPRDYEVPRSVSTGAHEGFEQKVKAFVPRNLTEEQDYCRLFRDPIPFSPCAPALRVMLDYLIEPMLDYQNP